VNVLGRELSQTLIDLRLVEAVLRQNRRHLLIGSDVTDQSEIRSTRIETLIRCGLRRHRARERRDRRDRDEDENNEQRFLHVNLLISGVPRGPPIRLNG